jgi:hypothetical protein
MYTLASALPKKPLISHKSFAEQQLIERFKLVICHAAGRDVKMTGKRGD